MNSLLLKNRPKDLTEEEFKAMWANSSYTLEALYNTIKDLTPKETIGGGDFDIPNHYAKLVWQQAQREFAQRILDFFPNSSK